MKKINFIRFTYVRQSSEHDCGTACLQMIMNYSGRAKEGADTIKEIVIPPLGLSLLDLRKIAESLGLRSRCVSLDLKTLQAAKHPVILHVSNDDGLSHFLVHYGAIQKKGKWQYLVGDPAKNLSIISQERLLSYWKSGAALFFENLTYKLPRFKDRAWVFLFSISSFPGALWIAIPFLNLCITFLGIGLSWTLQRGIDDSLTGKKINVIASVLILLLLITLFRNLIAYLRQLVLIKLNNAVNGEFAVSLFKRLAARNSQNDAAIMETNIKSSLLDVQKIQLAVSGFAAVILSEGTLIIFINTAIFYLQPVIAISLTCYIILLSLIAIRNAPYITLQTAHLNELSGLTEKTFFKELDRIKKPDNSSDANINNNYLKRYLDQARQIAIRISRLSLLYESLGSITVLLIFAYCLYQMEIMQMSYGSLMVFVFACYFVTLLMPKICAAWATVSDGANASRLFESNTLK
jgi:ABC-type bacteriocin/lantibiotic exporter with double-glycine peptidase domain